MNEGIQVPTQKLHNQENVSKDIQSHQIQTEKPKEILQQHSPKPEVIVGEKVINETVQEKPQTEEPKANQVQQSIVEETPNAKAGDTIGNKEEPPLNQEVQQPSSVKADAQNAHEQLQIIPQQHIDGGIKHQQEKPHTNQQNPGLNVDINPLENEIIFKPQEEECEAQAVPPPQKQQIKTETYKRVRQIQRPLDAQNTYEGEINKNEKEGYIIIARDNPPVEKAQAVEHKHDDSMSIHHQLLVGHTIQSSLQENAIKQQPQVDKLHQKHPEFITTQQKPIQKIDEITSNPQPLNNKEAVEPKVQNTVQINIKANIETPVQHKPQQTPLQNEVEKPLKHVNRQQEIVKEKENQKQQETIQHKQQQNINIMHNQDTNQKALVNETPTQQIVFVDKEDIQHAQKKEIIQNNPNEANQNPHLHVDQASVKAAGPIANIKVQQNYLANEQPILLESNKKHQQKQQALLEKVEGKQKELEQNHTKQVASQNATPAAQQQTANTDVPNHFGIKQVGRQVQHALPQGSSVYKHQINKQENMNNAQQLVMAEEKIENHLDNRHEGPNEAVKQQNLQEVANKIEAKNAQNIKQEVILVPQVAQHQVNIESAANEPQSNQPQPSQTLEHPAQKQANNKQIEEQLAIVAKAEQKVEQRAPEIHLASDNYTKTEEKCVQEAVGTISEQPKEEAHNQHPAIQKQGNKSQVIQICHHNQIRQEKDHQPSLPHKDQGAKQESNNERNQPIQQKEQAEGKQHIQINIIKIQSDQEYQHQNQLTYKEQKIEYVPEKPSQNEEGQKIVEHVKESQHKHVQAEDPQLHQVQKQNRQQIQQVNPLQLAQNIETEQVSAIPQNQHQGNNVGSGLPNTILNENSNTVCKDQAQKLQLPNIQLPHVQDVQSQQKQRYKFNTQNIETIQEQKPKNIQVVQFIEFHQQQKIQPLPQQLASQRQQLKKPVQSQSVAKSHHSNITFSASKDPPEQKTTTWKTIDVIHQQISQQKSPNFKQTIINKDGIGKIARKNVGEKRVNDVIEDLKKYDQKQPKKQPRPTSRRRKIDLSKVEHISLKSNIISVTVGQILSKDEHVQADKLLDEIDELKKKLFQLEKRKELAQIETIQKAQVAQKDTIMTNKSQKKILTGKIYKRADSNHSRVTQEVQTQGYATQKNNSIAISSAPRQRFSSTQDFSAPKTASKQVQFENKTGPVLFRVKKNNKTIQGPFDFHLNERETGFIKSKEFESEDKCFQAKRQDFEKLEFSQQEKFHALEKPLPRKLIFDEDFKEETDKYFIQLDNQPPKKDWDQEQLVQTARQTFKKFGINIQTQKNVTLSVKKYKNCVSFILDSSRTILWYYEGKFYFGGWKINRSGQGEKSGWGYDYSPGKYVFSGSFVENKRDGYGVIKLLTRQNDTIYEGVWKNGFKHGHGKQREADETQYIGEWAQGKKNGRGKIKGLSEQYFQGTFLSGVKNGEGAQQFKNGDSYEGNYYDGKFHGMGVYIWANLSKYQGQFREGSRNGNGIWVSNHTNENTDKYEGQYKNDRKSGFGVYRWKDGTVYQGQFLNDLKHGEGIVSYGDGKSTKLQWFEGNVVSKQNGDKQKISKRSISKSSSKKAEEKGSQTKPPLIKFNIGNETKLKPTRLSFGVEQF